jgi:ketosteroid isomerase-like protein
MKVNSLLVILIGLLSSFVVSAQAKDELAIQEVMNKQVNAWNHGDIDGFMTTYWKNDSLLFVGSKGPIYGWLTTLESYRKSYPDTVAMGKLNFEILRIQFLSYNYSFVLGKWHLTRSVGDTGGYFTLLFRKIKKQWVIVADHTSK